MNHTKTKLIFLAILFFGVFGLAKSSQAADWYVDNEATGTNTGTSWANAWQSIGGIQWGTACPQGKVCPGDTVYISGGAESQTYNESLTVGAEGSAGNLITIQVGQDSGHNGVVILDGTGLVGANGITINNKDYIKISGQVGSGASYGVKIQNFEKSGLSIMQGAQYFDIGYLEVSNNNTSHSSSAYEIYLYNPQPDTYGEIHHSSIHDSWIQLIKFGFPSSPYVATKYGSLKVHHNDIYNNKCDAIENALGGTDFYNNNIHGQTTTGGSCYWDGMHLYNNYYRIYNNKFYDQVRSDNASGNATVRWGDHITAAVGHFQMYNNLIYETATPYAGSAFRGIELAWTGASVTSVSDVLVANNTIIGIPFFAIALAYKNTIGSNDVSGITVENNIFLDVAKNSAVFIIYPGDTSDPITYGSHGSGADVVIDNNILYASSAVYKTNAYFGGSTLSMANFKTVSGSMGYASTETITTNPNLTATPVYALQVTSTNAINNGQDLSLLIGNTDILGNARTVWDIGAYAYTGQQSDTTPPDAPTGLSVN